MEQVKELFTDCTDVFEELVAVKKHLAENIEEVRSAVENIQSSLTKVDAFGPTVESQIQVHICLKLQLTVLYAPYSPHLLICCSVCSDFPFLYSIF